MRVPWIQSLLNLRLNGLSDAALQSLHTLITCNLQVPLDSGPPPHFDLSLQFRKRLKHAGIPRNAVALEVGDGLGAEVGKGLVLKGVNHGEMGKEMFIEGLFVQVQGFSHCTL